MIARLMLVMTLMWSSTVLMAASVDELSTPAKQQQYLELTEELRCPKCQNQNLAGSDSEISKSMKSLIKRELEAGQSPEQIKQGLINRYGEFISYKPPVNRQTFVLWFFPPLLIVTFALVWLLVYRGKKRVAVLSESQREQIEHLTTQDLNDGERS